MADPPAPGVINAGTERQDFLREVLAGLAERPKRLPGKFLWDEAGSIIFDRICSHADYYLTQREMALLPDVAREVARLVGPNVTVVEFGSGASRKIRTLLDALEKPARYIAIDISRAYLDASVRRLAADYPDVEMIPVCADYSKQVRLPAELDGTVLGFFPGASIGNVTPGQAQSLLTQARATLGPHRFLIGADPTRDEDRLRRAYGHCDGLMPALHLNLLVRLERELGAQIDRDAFRHEARILQDPFRMEAHLVASRANTWRLQGHAIAFEAGESVRTDVSHKYTPEAFQALAARSGWTPDRLWLAPDDAFSLHLLHG